MLHLALEPLNACVRELFTSESDTNLKLLHHPQVIFNTSDYPEVIL